MIRAPKGTPALRQGTRAGRCGKPVNLLSLFPTLLELCGLPPETHCDGPSLVPLLRNPTGEWPHASITYLGDPGSYGLSAQRWRYIHYANGDEELYDIASDPHEWTNLASRPEGSAKLAELRLLGPKSFAAKRAGNVNSLPKLAWRPITEGEAPASQPDGKPFEVVFVNRDKGTVKVFWMNRQGQRKFYAEIAAGKQYRQQTRRGAVWLITNSSDRALGHFRVGDRASQAVIPRAKPDK